MEQTCKDCRYYLPVDVFKGLCKLDKQQIQPDDLACPKLERQPKCKFCSRYTEVKDNLGTCDKSYQTYPDLNASKCISFEWYNLN